MTAAGVDEARRRRVGRPPLPPEQRRTRDARVRLNDAEHTRWAEAAMQAGYADLAVWVRAVVNAALAGQQAPGPAGLPADARELIAHLTRIGSNLNQIAKHANTTGGELPAYAARLLPLVAVAVQAVREAVGATAPAPDTPAPDAAATTMLGTHRP